MLQDETKKLLIFGLATVAVIIGGLFLVSRNPSSDGNSQPEKADPKLLVKADSFREGPDSAKVTIAEFGDYECPACKAAQPVVDQVMKDYDGKVALFFRNFPLPQHKNAQISAEAAEAAGAQGKFWEMHSKLYETQDDWVSLSDPMSKFNEYAKGLGLDLNKFQKDISSKAFQNRINSDLNDGNALFIDATPTFFVNGTRIVGVPSYSDFKRLIDKALTSN